MNRIWKPAVCLFGLILCVCAVIFYQQISRAIEAEKNLHATDLVMDVLSVYVTKNNEWPKTWGDISDVRPTGGHGIWDWPDDIEEIRTRIHISFETPVDETKLDAWVNSRNPTYGPSDSWREGLVNAIAASKNVKRQN